MGIAFDRPAKWEAFDGPRNGTIRVAFAQPVPWDGGVQPYVHVFMEDAGGNASIDTTTPPNAGVVASKIFTVAGVPARLTAQNGPDSGGQVYKSVELTVQWAKGTRFFQMDMVFAKSCTDQYLNLAERMCATMEILPRN